MLPMSNTTMQFCLFCTFFSSAEVLQISRCRDFRAQTIYRVITSYLRCPESNQKILNKILNLLLFITIQRQFEFKCRKSDFIVNSIILKLHKAEMYSAECTLQLTVYKKN